jgi:tRNA pseudouridine55 synthase
MSETLNGAVVVDKPAEWTSHDVVNKIRRIFGTKKVGHLGTLDPAATGVLPLLVNRATRLEQFFSAGQKEYEGVIRFGYATSTYDADGEPLGADRPPELTWEDVERVLRPFRGTFLQAPPPVSAKKIGGRPAYELARKQVEFELKPVEVTVYSIEVLDVNGCRLKLKVRCSPGTYLRAIAHDAGRILGCGAFLETLRRTVSGPFGESQARTIEQLEALAQAGRLQEALVPASELLPEFPSQVVDTITETQIRQGRDFRVSPFRGAGSAKYVKAVNGRGELVAIGEASMPNVYHPVVVL